MMSNNGYFSNPPPVSPSLSKGGGIGFVKRGEAPLKLLLLFLIGEASLGLSFASLSLKGGGEVVFEGAWSILLCLFK